MTGSTSSALHLFVDDRGEVLERWQEAFPDARAEALAPARKLLQAGTAAAVWVRLPAKKAALRRLQAVLAAATVPVLVLADVPDEEQGLVMLGAGARAYVNTHAAPVLLQRAWSTVEAGGLWVGESLKQRLLRATERAGRVADWPTDAAKALRDTLDVSDRSLAESPSSVLSARRAPPVADRRR